MTSLSPIGPFEQQQVLECVNKYIQLASDNFQKSFRPVPVLFDLKGKMAGMYRVQGRKRVIRFNPWIFSKYFDENLGDTVPHEVAHYIADQLYGIKNIRPHGTEWQNIMRVFQVEPNRTHNFELSGVPQRRHRRFQYACSCRTHELSSRMHNWIQAKKREYYCRSCQGKLAACESADSA